MKRAFILAVALGWASWAKPQSELTLPFLPDVFQASYLNPTVRPEHTVSIGLPGVSSAYLQVISNGFVPSAIGRFSGDTLVISPGNLPGAMRRRNLLMADLALDVLHVRVKVFNWDFWFAARERLNTSLFYPGDLFRLAVEGNDLPPGSSLDLSTMGINASSFAEYTFGLAADYEQWVVGGRLSLLQGRANMHMNPRSASLTMLNDMYGMQLAVDGALSTSGIPRDSAGFALDQMDNEWAIDRLSLMRNLGFALSGGFAYNFNPRATLSIAFSDLGFIRWREGVHRYQVTAQVLHNGLDIIDDLLANSLDTITIPSEYTDPFVPTETSPNYTTWLAPRLQTSAHYRFPGRTNVGVQVHTVVNRRLYSAFTLGLSQGVGRFFNILGTASFSQRTFNLGAGLVIKPGPLQLYVVLDNFLPAMAPLTLTNLNVRAGVNLVFGRIKPPNALPYR